MVEAKGKQDYRILPLGRDHLSLRAEYSIIKYLKENECVIFSCKLLKFNKYGMK